MSNHQTKRPNDRLAFVEARWASTRALRRLAANAPTRTTPSSLGGLDASRAEAVVHHRLSHALGARGVA